MTKWIDFFIKKSRTSDVLHKSKCENGARDHYNTECQNIKYVCKIPYKRTLFMTSNIFLLKGFVVESFRAVSDHSAL